MDELTWLQQGESMLRHNSSLKRCFDVAIEIFRSRHRNQLNTEKTCRDRKYGSRHEDRLQTENLCRDQKN